ncbi:MAG TPA: 2-phosphosulfolactate phosphatase, partial [Planctomycetota bacterium]|nr:2-phosphosulfolactate phosphatase [Planctomycetota bacterium]
MRVHVALTPGEFPSLGLGGRVALVIDVLRASTSVVAACAAGCRQVIPVATAEAARESAARLGDALLAGERGGDMIPGFDLGNSPLEFTPERVRGRSIVLTTTNGTAAMLAAAGAEAAAVAALTNVEAAARWAAAQERDVTLLCSGEAGRLSLEDAVCAGVLVDRLAAEAPIDATDAAMIARRASHYYARDLARLVEDSGWARKLTRAGREADLAACLAFTGIDMVPVLIEGAVVPGAPASAPAAARPS